MQATLDEITHILTKSTMKVISSLHKVRVSSGEGGSFSPPPPLPPKKRRKEGKEEREREIERKGREGEEDLVLTLCNINICWGPY